MKFIRHNQPKPRIGLTISDTHITAIAITPTKQQNWQIEANISLAIETTPPTHLLKQLRQQLPSQYQQLILGMPFPQVMIKNIALDCHLNDATIQQYLPQQLAQWFNTTPESLYYDYQPDPNTPAPPEQQNFHIIAIRRTTVQPWLSACQAASFKVQAVDIDAFALQHIHPYLIHPNSPRTQAIIYLSLDYGLFTVIHQDTWLYTQQMGITTHLVQSAIQQALALFSTTYPQYPLTNLLVCGDTSLLNLEPHQSSLQQLQLNSTKIKSNAIHLTKLIDSPQIISLGLALRGHNHVIS